MRYSAARLWPWGAGTGTRGWAGLRSRAAAALRGKAALAAGLSAEEDRLRPERLRRALTAGTAPARRLVRGAPISGPGSHSEGAWHQLPGCGRNSGAKLGSKYKAGWWPLCGTVPAARFTARRHPRALKTSFEKCPFERKRPPPGPAGTAQGKFCFLFQIILVTLTV